MISGSLSAGITHQSTMPDYLSNKFKTAKSLPGQSKIQAGEYLETTKRNYHVRNYDLTLDWFDAITGSLRWDGEVKMQIEATEDQVSQIELDAVKLITRNVRINGEETGWDATDTLYLRIDLPTPLAKGETIDLDVDYTYDSRGEVGFISNYPYLAKQKFTIYTMSEPKDARYWVPCNDLPIDRATWTKTIKLPRGYVATSNGALTDSIISGDTVKYVWTHNFPMPTYLQAVTASEFECVHKEYTRNDGSILPIRYYTWKGYIKDGDVNMDDKHLQMLKFFSDYYFEYPYEKYGFVTVYNMGGGMEHTTLTTCDDSWITFGYPDGFAHELAHNWLGNYITCADWQDLWINEGGATWSENRWEETQTDPEATLDYFRRDLTTDRIFFLNSGNIKFYPIYGLDDANLFNEALTYRKAGWVYQMIYDALGEEQFKHTMRKIFETYPLTSITTQQFRDIVKQENPDYPISWDTFFKQWLLQGSYPALAFDYSSRQEDGKFISTFRVSQSVYDPINAAPDYFEIPIKMRYYREDNSCVTTTHFMKSNELTFSDTLDFTPQSCSYYEYATLAQFSSFSGIEDSPAEGISLYPQPAKVGESLNIRLGEKFISSDAKFEILDLFCRKVAGGAITSTEQNIFLPNIATGTYFVKIMNNGKTHFEKITIAN